MANLYDCIELTKSNHLRYWYGRDRDRLFRLNPLETFNMSVGVPSLSDDRSFSETLMDTAKALHIKEPNLDLFLSGGLDSEVALWAFKISGINIQPVILRFSNDYNIEDVEGALELCSRANLIPSIVDIDPVSFFISGEWKHIAVKYQAYTFYQQLLLHVAESRKTPFITIDEIETVKIDDDWFFIKKEDQDACWHRYMALTKNRAYNNFYTYDPATIWKFFTSDTVRKLIKNKIFGKLGWSSSKNEIYRELTGLQMPIRKKRHGMEKMMDIWEQVEKESSLLLPVTSPCVAKFRIMDLLSNDTRNDSCEVICTTI